MADSDSDDALERQAGLGGEPDDDPLEDVPSSSTTAAMCAEPGPEPGTAECVLSISTRVEYSALPRGSVQDVFGLVTVTAADAADEEAASEEGGTKERQAMDITCVLDISGSMTGQKIDLLKDAVRFLIDQAQATDRLSIVTFSHTAARHLRMRRMDAEGKNEAIEATLKLRAGGGTDIAAGLAAGISVMERRRVRNKVSAVLLLTDGLDSSARSRMPALLTRAREQSCSVYPFGFGRDHDAALLAEMAEQAMTPFTFVEDVEHIREAFAGTVGGLSSVVAQNIELSLSCPVKLKEVHTPFAVERTSEQVAKVLIPDIFAGERRDVLVELSVPMESLGEDAPAEISTRLLDAQVQYTDLRRGVTSQTPVVTMSAERVDVPQPEAEPDEEVSAQRERIEVTRSLREAAAMSDVGDFEGAQKMLQSHGEKLKAKKKQTRMSPALLLELDDASSRMANRSMWEAGGRAEVKDSMQMHMTQRCTNVSVSKSSSVMKVSKAMYVNKKAQASISKSKRSADEF